MKQVVNRIKHVLSVLEEAIYTDEVLVQDIYYKQIDYNQRECILEAITEPGWVIFENGSRWGGKDLHACFKTHLQITEEQKGQDLWLRLATGAVDIWNTDNPQFLIYCNGEILCGMDLNHNEVCITPSAKEGDVYEIGLYAYSNSQTLTDYLRLSFFAKNRQVEKLYYDCKVPFEVALELQDEDLNRIHILEMLNQVINQLDLRYEGSKEFFDSIEVAEAWLQEHFYKNLTGEYPIKVHSIGHTHIDVAWKWEVKQTREKVLRSFSTVLHLMEEYPSYRFMSSQPQLYEFVKEESPELYEQIKKRISEGRWETEGAMWLESDCNLTSGESLVRQILYGKAFFQKEFGTGDNKVLWLPDVFGYSAALPQIMKKSGISYFMTTKIAWNEYNKFPNDLMLWKGIDGSEVLTYFITTTNHQAYPELIRKKVHSTTYNGRQNASQVMGTWQRFSNKNLTSEVLTCYGYGDGGGGPTAQMLEEDMRLSQGIPGCPVTRQTFVKDFFEGLEEKLEDKKVPKWSGELYLEYHRGTYTSMARNKKYNRICEFRNQDAEMLNVWAGLLESGHEYPKEELDEIWKITMLNQFHDILPGTSIEEVYQTSKEEYEDILTRTEALINQSADIVAGNTLSDYMETVFDEESMTDYCVFNTLSFPRSALIDTPNGPILIKDIPAKGYRRITSLEWNDSPEDYPSSFKWKEKNGMGILDTPFYQVEFSEKGSITSLYDKEADREIVQKGKALNRLMAFEDRPYEYDSWNIDVYYEEKEWDIDQLKEWKVIENNRNRFGLALTYIFLSSTIHQNIYFYKHSKRIDFQTEIDWKEQQILLKAAFPVEVMATKAVCDIQFGNVERPTHRNTSWDEARFEFCAHKWVDLAEAGYGVALLNDCKYGYDVLESTMRLTLLKSGIFPNPNADKEHHSFTYSLLPHLGDFRKGHVVREAYDLNVPVYLREKKGTILQDSLYFIDCENVISETCKSSEDGKAIIIRFFECFGKRSKTICDLSAFGNIVVKECDLLEKVLEEQKDVGYEHGQLHFTIHPYEIKTFRLEIK